MKKGQPLPPKRDVVHALLAQGAAFLHLDPRGDDVMVPEWLKQQPQLVLQIGLNMPVPIRDLRIDEEGVFGTLSFSRAPFTCLLPWDSIFALVGDDGRGMVWPESMPEEIAQEIQREALRAGLSAIAESDAAADASVKSTKPRRARKAAAPAQATTSSAKASHDPTPTEAARSSSPEPRALRVIEGNRSEPVQRSVSRHQARRGAPHLRLVKPD